jgi:hypothetical protein
LNCGHGVPFEEADKVVERCTHCPRLEAFKGMKLFVVWLELHKEPDLFVGVYTSEAKANNDGRSFESAYNKLVEYNAMGKFYLQTVEPNKMADPKVFS